MTVATRFDLERTIEILRSTPTVLDAMLSRVSSTWTAGSDRNDWQPQDILGHLIHGEKTDWLPRARQILEKGTSDEFEPFDRFAQFEDSKGKPIPELLTEFRALRSRSLQELKLLDLSPSDLGRKGLHPALGEVTLAQLLASWAVHDLNHINQINKAMARRYSEAVGPWKEYLGILVS